MISWYMTLIFDQVQPFGDVNIFSKYYFSFIRSGLTFVCGIYVFGMTWLLLGTNPEESVGPAVAPQFMVSTCNAEP